MTSISRDYLALAWVTLFNHSTDLVALLDSKGDILAVNRAGAVILGGTEHSWIGKPFHRVLEHTDGGRFASDDFSNISKSLDFKTTVNNAKGEARLVRVEIWPIDTGQGPVTGALAVVRELWEDKPSDERILGLGYQRQCEVRLLNQVVQVIRDGVVITNSEGTILYANSSVLNRSGYEQDELFEKSASCLFAPEADTYSFEQIIQQVLSTGGWEGEVMAVTKPGERVPVFVTSLACFDSNRNPFAVILVFRDLSRRKTIEEHLIRTEKLAAMGQLIAGVSHELNNPLSGIMGFSELLLAKELKPEIRHQVGTILKEAERMRRIVKNLLSFGRQWPPQKEIANLNDVLEDTIALRKYELSVNNIAMEKSLDPDLPRTLMDPHQIQQVILNVVNNAKDALMEKPAERRLRFRTRVIQEKSVIRLEISDDGPGIDAIDLMRIFNPFFTTKEIGKGTGLGLSVSYGIMKEHGGHIDAVSEKGRGSTFRIELPILAPSEGPSRVSASSPRQSENAGMGCRVLIVDDENVILDLFSAILSEMGCVTESAEDGKIAFKKLTEKEYDLILCDLKMPRGGGEEFYENVRWAKPQMAKRIVFLSGDTLSEDVKRFLGKSGNRLLAKPINIEEFKNAVKDFFLENPRSYWRPAKRL